MSSNWSIKKLSRIGFYIIVSIACIMIFFPFYWMVHTSLLQSSDLFRWPPIMISSHPQWQSYIQIFKVRPLSNWLLNTLIVGFLTTIVSIFVSILGAYSLSRYNFRGKRIIQIFILTVQMVPPVLLVVPIFIIFRYLHLIDNPLGLVIAFSTFSIPICIWMLKGFFDTIPIEIENAARIDGCSTVGIIFRITLPLSLPGIMAVGLFAFMLVWSEYLIARVLIMSETNYVVSLGLASFYGQYSVPWDQIMAAATIIALPAVFIFMFMQKYLLQGLTAGALKE